MTTATLGPPAARSRRTPGLDPACAGAIEQARDVARQLANASSAAATAELVGEHLGVEAEADRVVTHYFACLLPGYVGWRWAVTLARASRAKLVTVDEAVLLPGPGALLAPEWLPWSERLRPGDLGVGDLMPADADDERLVPGYAALDPDTGEDVDAAQAWELGLGRARVLSQVGLDDAVDRWYSGEHGPAAPMARAAPAQCSTCGFLLPLSGSLRTLFGVCANEYSPSDGSVVSVDHGCGAHSEATVASATGGTAGPVVDYVGFDLVELQSRSTRPDAGSVDGGEPARPE